MANPGRVTDFIRAFLKNTGDTTVAGQSAEVKPN
jgi:hypothetical protein